MRDVTADAAFQRPIASLAGLFDQQVRADLSDAMTYRSEDGGARAGLMG